MFLDLGRWICMVFETLSKRLGLAYSKINLSLLQHQSASQEMEDFVRCMCTIDLSLLHLKRASDTQNHHLWIPEHQGTGDFVRSECVKLVLL